MRLALRSIALLAAMSGIAQPAGPVRSKLLTIVMDFEGPHSTRAVAAMEKELEGLMKTTGLTFQFRSPEEAVNSTYDDLIVVRFRGKCILRPDPNLYDEQGPLAFTHSAEGTLLPFSEVECNTVTKSMRQAMFGGDYAHADLLLGRALGRVLAHELVHILTQSKDHGKEGVAKPALSGQQLIAGTFPLSPEDLERLNTDKRQ